MGFWSGLCNLVSKVKNGVKKGVKKIKEKVENALKNFDKEITIHDFRVVTAKGHSNVIFDIVIPYGKNYNKYELIGVLEEGFKDEDKKYYFIFNIDRPFC